MNKILMLINTVYYVNKKGVKLCRKLKLESFVLPLFLAFVQDFYLNYYDSSFRQHKKYA